MKLPKSHGVCRHLFRIALVGGGLLALTCPSGAKATITMESAVHVPTSGWLVGPATLAPAAAGEKMPCLMANQFDNGYTLRFSGGGDRMMAVAIDFRAASFDPGESYPVNISVKDKFSQVFQALAYNSSTLIVNTEGSEELYHSLTDGKILAFGLSGRLFEFAMLGVRDGLKRVESCYKPDGAQAPLAPAGAAEREASAFSLRNTGRDVSNAGAEEEKGNRGTMVKNMDYTQHDLLPLPAAEPEHDAGGELGAMINQAAARLSQVRDESPASQPAVQTHASAAPVAEPVNSRTDGPPVMTTQPRPLGMAPAIAERPDILVPRKGAEGDAAQAAASNVRHWRAIKGANLREVLDVWTRGSNKELAWMADQEFPVEKSLIFRGSFESAVLTLLEQYGGESERPVGRIYHDPEQNKQILVIQSAE